MGAGEGWGEGSWQILVLCLLFVAACGRPDASTPPAEPPPATRTSDSDRVSSGDEIFTDATAASGLDFVHFNGMSGEFYFAEMMGGGAALFDADGDGDLDLYLVQGGVLPTSADIGEGGRLYRNQLVPTEELRFIDVTEESGLAVVGAGGYGMGVTAGDFDNDGRVDLYVTALGSNRLLRNFGEGAEGDLAFVDVTAEAGADDPRWSVAAAFFDYDRDGWLDLYVGNYVDFTVGTHKPCYDAAGARDYCAPSAYRGVGDRLFRNRRGSVPAFEDASLTTGIGAASGSGLGAVTADFDGDGWLDLYIANDGEPNFLWRNQVEEGVGPSFRDRALIAGAAVDEDGRPQASMGVDAGDVDNDGDEDLFMSHLNGESNALFLNQGDGDFLDATTGSGLGSPSLEATGFGTAFLDYDNDSWLDLLVVNGAVKTVQALAEAGDPYPLHQQNQLFHNLGQGEFEEVSELAGPSLLSEVSRGAAFGDVDNDGDTDVVTVANNGTARLMINRVGQDRSWIGLRLVSGDPGRDALGARVEIVPADGGPSLWRRSRSDGSYASANDPRVLVGLGDFVEEVDVRVLWPDGSAESWSELAARRYHLLRQGDGRSAVGARGRAPAAGASVVAGSLSVGAHGRAPASGAATPAGQQAPSGRTAVRPYTEEVPRPDLSRVEEAVQRQLEKAAARVESLSDSGQRGVAMGELGRLYHAYDLLSAAESAYRLARALRPDDARWVYYLGFLHQTRGELEAAVLTFSEFLEQRPDDLPALLRQGDVLLTLDRPAAARPLFERALALAPASAPAHYGLGKIAAREGDALVAVEHFERTLELQPQATLVHYPLARAYLALGERQRAQDHLARRGTSSPVFPDPLVQSLDELAVGAGLRLTRAGVALAEGRRAAAVEEYRQAVEAAPGNVSARLDLALLLASEGDLEGARSEIEQALRLAPDNALVHDALGTISALAEDDEKAILYHRRALELAPDFQDSRFRLGAALARLGRNREAVVELSAVLEIYPQHPAARLARATALLDLGQVEAARDDLLEILDRDPSNGSTLLRLGEALQRLGDPAAFEAYVGALEAGLEDPAEAAAAHLSAGNLLAARREDAKAAEQYQEALELAPTLAEARFNLAGILNRLGRQDEAAAQYAALVEIQPENASARLYLAETLFSLGRYREARGRLEADVAALPQNGHLAHALARTLAACPDRSLRDGPRALELALAVLQSSQSGGRPPVEHAETVAMAFAETGRFDEAVKWQRQVISAAERTVGAERLAALRANLGLYERRERCCS